MRYRYVGILLCMVVGFGCRGPREWKYPTEITAKNTESLRILKTGMSKEEVLTIMGTKTIWAHDRQLSRAGIGRQMIANPYRIETMEAKGKTVEVLYYYTEESGHVGIDDDELTPLLFEDAKLTGFGWSYFEDSINRYELKIQVR